MNEYCHRMFLNGVLPAAHVFECGRQADAREQFRAAMKAMGTPNKDFENGGAE